MTKLDLNELRLTISKKNLGWEAAENEFSTYTEDQLDLMFGVADGEGEESLKALEEKALKNFQSFKLSASAKKTSKAKAYGYPNYSSLKDRGFMTPVKDQKSCGSCVAFGNIAALEGTYKMRTGHNHDFSEAHLFYCHGATDSYYNAGCRRGWYTVRGAHFLKEKGVVWGSSFPYTPGDQACKSNLSSHSYVKIRDYKTLTTHAQMKDWLHNRGPLVTDFTVYADFMNYKSGIYRRASNQRSGGHCVCVVGYDDINQCWICKNSWGPNWGENGYFRIGYGQCGIDARMYGFEGVLETGQFYAKITMAEAYTGGNYVRVDRFGYRYLKNKSNGQPDTNLFALAILAKKGKTYNNVFFSNGELYRIL